MPCPRCGADTPHPGGRCTSCEPTIAFGSTPRPGTSDDATRLSSPGAARAASGTHGPLKPGEAFGTRYRILRTLGSGGMGVVYQTWDEELGVAVALKVIRPEVTADPQAAEEVERRFKRELLLARQVTHKNVVRIHDLGEVDGTKYITMPFVDGKDLATILRDTGPLPIPRVLRIARQVVAGLQAAHDAGVVHRDLKPENIMVDAEDQALIMDFGISRSITGTGAGTVLGTVVGTLEYMSPEQGRGLAADQRADIYSFGLMLYDMIAGRRRLLTTESPVAEMMSRMSEGVPPLRTRAPQVPEALEAVISRCLNPDPARRFQTTAELAAALDALDDSGQGKVQARPRARLPIWAAGLAVLSLASFAAYWWSGTAREGTPAAAPRETVSVLVADFDNQAKDPVFDGLVEQALAIGLESASFVTVYPRRDALRRAQQVAGGAQLDARTARLLSISEGVDVVVSGTILKSGDGYRLNVRVARPQADGTERGVLDASVDASDREKVLPAVGKLAGKVRAALGDATADGERAADAETFTARTIEAAHAYAKAQELSWGGQIEEAIAQYREAIRLDPDFGRAYSGLAALYSNLGKREEAAQNYQLAMAKLDRMTEREVYRTRSGYYLFARNPAKAIEESQTLIDKYPADSAAIANLAVALVYERRMQEAQEMGRRAVAIYPKNVVRRSNAALFAMYAGDFPAAETQAKETLALNPEYAKAHVALAMAQLGQGRPADAEQTWRRLETMPGGKRFAIAGLVDHALFEGRLADAARLAEQWTPAEDPRRLATLAEIRLLQGNEAAAAAAASAAADAARASDDPADLYLAGRVLAQARRPQASEIAENLQRRLDREARVYGALLAGEVALIKNDVQRASDAFHEAQKFVDTWLGRFWLARASLAAKEYADAARDFEGCLKRRGEATAVFLDEMPTYRFLPTLYYYIGVAQAGQNRPAWRDSLNTFLSFKARGDEQGLVADARRRLQQ